MSFAAIRNTAYTSLMATQVKMQVTASNIANVDVPGYTRKMASQVNMISGGVSTGISITGITSAVNKFLVRDIAESMTEHGAAAVTGDYSYSMQKLFGNILGDADGKGNTLAHKLAKLEDTLNQLAGTPEDDSFKYEVVSDLEAIAIQLRKTSGDIQQLRANADGEIGVAVVTANSALHAIDDLNKQIALATALGQPTADLEDLRNNAVQTLSGQMDVHYYVNGKSEMQINTLGGTPLLNSHVHELNYSSQSVVTSDTSFNQITVDGEAVTDEVYSGRIGGLIAVRDDMLPDMQAEIDMLAVNLIGVVNEAYNTATAMPAPSVLTGSNIPVPAATFPVTPAASGDMHLVLMDGAGVVGKVLDIDLAGITTTADLVDAINLANNLASDPLIADIASVVDGQLVLTAPAGQGIAVTGGQIGGKGVSAYFGLNNLLVGESAVTIKVRPDIKDNASLLANGMVDATAIAGEAGIIQSADFVQDIANLFTDAHAFGASGGLGAITTSFADYAAAIVDHAATTARVADEDLVSKQTGMESLRNAMAAQTGVNMNEETAMMSELEKAFSTAAQIFEVLNKMFDDLLQAAKSA